MSGPKRNPDSLNTIGVVVVGICGAVMVYVSITALQAFYMNDTSELQTMADYGGQDTIAKTSQGRGDAQHHRARDGHELDHDRSMRWTAIVKSADEARVAGKPATLLVPGACEENMPTEVPQRGRPVLDMTRIGGCKGGKAPPPPPPGSTAAAGTGSGSGSGSDAAGRAGSAATPANGKTGKTDGKKAGKGAGSGDNGANIHLHSTGQGGPGDTHAVGGASGAPVGHPDSTNAGSAAKLAPGGHAP